MSSIIIIKTFFISGRIYVCSVYDSRKSINEFNYIMALIST